VSPAVAPVRRIKYFVSRLASFNLSRPWGFAKQIAEEQGKWAPGVLADMMVWAAFHDTAYIDFYEADFALLTKKERKTFMTALVQHHLADTLNDPVDVLILENKISFHKRFAEYAGRDWLDLDNSTFADFQGFVARHPIIIAKTPVGREGKGVFRYDMAEVADAEAFRTDLITKGQTLLEEPIVQHPYLAEYCAGTVNTTRVATFFDGEKVHILMGAQKFGRGSVSDQFTWGGFFTMLDENGRSFGPGHTGKHVSRYETHPESSKSIVDFQVPLWDEVVAFLDRAARELPTVPYVGWDIAVGPDGPILVEGNWTPGLYETRVSATGIRTGSRERHKPVLDAAAAASRR